MLHAVNKVTGECGQKILPSLDREIKEKATWKEKTSRSRGSGPCESGSPGRGLSQWKVSEARRVSFSIPDILIGLGRGLATGT